MNEDNLEEEHSTRNARLMRILEDAHVVENRGSGVSAMVQALRDANLEPPRFDDRRSSFRVAFRNHTLMTPDAIEWINQFRDVSLNDRQRVALVYLRNNQHITNSEYRRLNHVNALIAGDELRGLVRSRLVEQHGIGRGTFYRLTGEFQVEPRDIPLDDGSDEEKVIGFVREHASIGNTECRKLLGTNVKRASYLLGKLVKEGVLTKQGEKRWARYTLVV